MPSGRKGLGLDEFIKGRVSGVMQSYFRDRRDKPLPVDLAEIARLAGVVSIEEREMIPQAVIVPTKRGFKVFLQSNFNHFPGARIRQRFSLAHEIAHTFFFNSERGRLKPIGFAPTGERLESACHKAAGLILVPDAPLQHAIRTLEDFPRAEHVPQLAAIFDVSPEVLLRRLPISDFDSTQRNLVLTRNPEDVIEWAAWPLWFRAFLPKPQRGTRFGMWFQTRVLQVSQVTPPSGAAAAITHVDWGSISATRVPIGPSSAIYELFLAEPVRSRTCR
jgi:Zn-dependent peptidase ImmA (M78 family)